ncbi:hypothetical protein B0H67DRAFT_482728 [Lasiosphaeris hirsuta]|uniref:Protein kinase domain-containing protein n=1 Tax=Lasiosphaeris hirsuta TaxID=260670 RepID=A0AA40E598_9PEZI|nr:hypothetical protein B0H67DRAFT_482728 [Lasiosphaeris hirsuta]
MPQTGITIPLIIASDPSDTAPNSQNYSSNDLRRSPDQTVAGRPSPGTSYSARLDSDSDADADSDFLTCSSSSADFSSAEDGLSPSENLLSGTVRVELEVYRREEAIGESSDELVERRPDLTPSPPRSRNSVPAVNQAARAAFNRLEDPLPTLRARLQPAFHLPEEQSEITDFGRELHYKERKSRSRRTGRPKVSGKKSLGNRLFEALEFVDDNTKDKGFFPLDLLPLFLTEQSVSKELRKELGNILGPDEIARYTRKICSEQRVDSFEKGTKPRTKTYRKIFATLVLIVKTPAIRKFIIEGVNDSDLPLRAVKSESGYVMERARAPGKPLKCFQSGWTSFQMRNFEDWQWTTLAPFFARSKERKEICHYPLQDRVILPFRIDSKQDDVNQELLGGGGRVFKAFIHPDHHNFHGFFKCPRASTPDESDEPPKCICVFAIKCLHSQDKKTFKKEVDMLKRFSNNAHPHLISLLATYEQKGAFFLIFPRAEDDLQAYWKKTAPPTSTDSDGVCWVAEQCLGIAKGVLKIHEYESSNSQLHPLNMDRVVGHHGDIKPENVLWFRETDTHDHTGRGTLKLSDFGLADFSSRQTASRPFHSSISVTCNYRAPECDLNNQGGKGRQYDMWTLGCLYLEFLTWLVGGSALLQEFTRARLSVDTAWFGIMTDTFFQLEKSDTTGEPYAVVKPSVTERLHSDNRSSPFIREFLGLIETGLLVVKKSNPRIGDRLSIEQAHAKLTGIVRKCKTQREYTFISRDATTE